MRKLNVGDYVVLDMTGCWSFEHYTDTKAEIIEIDNVDNSILVRTYSGMRVWTSEKHIKRKVRSDK